MVSKPSILFSRLVTETLAAGGRVVLDPGETVFQAGTVLTGHLQSFGVDADRREAVVVYDAALAAPDNSLRSRRFEARVPLAAIDPATVVPRAQPGREQGRRRCRGLARQLIRSEILP